VSCYQQQQQQQQKNRLQQTLAAKFAKLCRLVPTAAVLQTYTPMHLPLLTQQQYQN
jgi:hypothetical protein